MQMDGQTKADRPHCPHVSISLEHNVTQQGTQEDTLVPVSKDPSEFKTCPDTSNCNTLLSSTMAEVVETHHEYTVHWCSCAFPVQAPGTLPHHSGVLGRSIHGYASAYSPHHTLTTGSKLTSHQALPDRKRAVQRPSNQKASSNIFLPSQEILSPPPQSPSRIFLSKY